MSTPPNVPAGSSLDSRVATPPTRTATDPIYWSIRRELWENRSLTIAPLAVAAFVLFVLLMVTAFTLPRKMRTLAALDPAQRHALVAGHSSMAPGMIMIITILVGIFYSLDALYGERRDRSILFWKSLPVSDRTTVLSKAAIPLVVLPLFGFALSVATQVILLLWSTVVLMGSGMSPAPLWAELRFIETLVVLLYGIGAFTLWHAPMYAWLLLVSGWARRMPVLWAFVPLVAVSMVERMAFHTSYIASFYRYRFMGALPIAFNVTPAKDGHFGIIDRFTQLNPARFLSTPDLWLGLLLAAAFLAAAVRLRRYREPI